MERTATRSESLLRPREIQVRIRAGQTPETVAAAAQTSVERVMVFATPVLAERAFVAQQAARASVRRRVGDGQVGLLGEAVAHRLESLGLDPESAEWDAWRREDARWTVVAAWVEAGEDRQAQFTYDAMGRYVVAEDDPARWLVGERHAAEPSRTPDPLPEDTAQLALGDDALQVVTGRPLTAVRPAEPVEPVGPVEPLRTSVPAAAARADAEPTEDLTETVRAVRAVAAPDPVGVARPVAPQPVVAELPAQHPAPSAVDQPVPATGSSTALTASPAVAEGEGLFADGELRAPAAPTTRRTSRPVGASRPRRSMPSWDDIMLGSAPRGD